MQQHGDWLGKPCLLTSEQQGKRVAKNRKMREKKEKEERGYPERAEGEKKENIQKKKKKDIQRRGRKERTRKEKKMGGGTRGGEESSKSSLWKRGPDLGIFQEGS